MDSVTHTPFRYSLVLLISILFVSGCSGSSDPDSGDSQVIAEATVVNGGDSASNQSNDGTTNGVEDATIVDSQTELSGGADEPADGSRTDAEGVTTTRVFLTSLCPTILQMHYK